MEHIKATEDKLTLFLGGSVSCPELRSAFKILIKRFLENISET
jgi:hypothetical protein